MGCSPLILARSTSPILAPIPVPAAPPPTSISQRDPAVIAKQAGREGGEEAEIVLLAQCSDASGKAAPAAQGTGGDVGTARSPQPCIPSALTPLCSLSTPLRPQCRGACTRGTPGEAGAGWGLSCCLAQHGGTGGAMAAAGATSERPPRSSRERAVLPSKEMRSLPCAAHLGSPPCYFYLTFQGLFPFSGCFRCDSTITSTSFFFPSLPPSLLLLPSLFPSFPCTHSHC